MRQPTEEEIEQANKELNKWCGTKGINYYEGVAALGFLFKYAVPKVISHNDYFRLEYNRSNNEWDCQVGLKVRSHKDPAPLLFWAIKEVQDDRGSQ